MTKLNIWVEDNNNRIYSAGQILKGTVELHLEEPKKVRGLYFAINGRAFCHWTERQRRTNWYSNRSEYHQVIFEGENVYLNQRNYLFGQKGGETIEVPSGTHRYAFETLLPPMLPESFEAKHGNIRYNIEACLDIPWKFDKETRIGFTVVRNEDLNLYPELEIPLKFEKIERFCCLFCESEPLMVTAIIPFGGFTPGSKIPMKIEYINKSDVSVPHLELSLKRIIRCNSQIPYCKSNIQIETVCKEIKEGVKPLTSKTAVEKFQLPSALVKTNVRFCGVVQVSYELHVELITSGCHGNIKFFFPIVIGHIPIDINRTRQNASLQMPYNPDMLLPCNSGNQMPYNPSAPLPTAPLIQNGFINPLADLPPSFDEAMKTNPEKKESAKIDQSVGWNVHNPPSAPAEP